jgi:O-antigen ligase
MAPSSVRDVERPDRLVQAFAGVLFVVTAGSLLVPRGAALLLGLLGLAALVVHLRQTSGAKGIRAETVGLPLAADPLTLALLAFAGYAALTALWSKNPLLTLGKAAWLGVVVVTANLVIGVMARQGPVARELLGRAFLVGFAVGAAVVMVEVLSDQALTRALYNMLDILRPASRKHVIEKDGVIVSIGRYVTNRNIGALNLLLWPALLAALVTGTRGAAAFAALMVYAVALAATLLSEHESSQVAILLAAAVLVIAFYLPRFGRPLVAAGWAAAVLGAIPAALIAYQAELYKAAYLPTSAQARIVLWHFTASETLKQPVLGVGAASTKAIDEEQKPAAQKLPDQPYAQRTGQHAHNVYMQTWYELGAVGAVLLLVAGVLLWRAILRLPGRAQPFALAGFASAMVIAAFTWGLWQEWYQSLFGLAVIGMALCARDAGDA